MNINMHRIVSVKAQALQGQSGPFVDVQFMDEAGNDVTMFFKSKAAARAKALDMLSAILMLPDDKPAQVEPDDAERDAIIRGEL